MKINITSETLGTEIITQIIGQLAASDLKINAKEEEITPLVQNKEGKWVQFDAAKIKFVYSK
jgi:hypothetical protein